MFITIQNN